MQFAENRANAVGAFRPNFGHMPLALFSTRLGWTLGDHPKAAIDDQVKSGHREKA